MREYFIKINKSQIVSKFAYALGKRDKVRMCLPGKAMLVYLTQIVP